MLRLVSLAVSFVFCTLLLALAGCGGGPSFAGTFTGSYQGQEASFALTREGARLGGSVRWAGMESEVTGTVDGKSATGTVRNATMGIEFPFEPNEVRPDKSATAGDEEGLHEAFVQVKEL